MRVFNRQESLYSSIKYIKIDKEFPERVSNLSEKSFFNF